VLFSDVDYQIYCFVSSFMRSNINTHNVSSHQLRLTFSMLFTTHFKLALVPIFAIGLEFVAYQLLTYYFWNKQNNILSRPRKVSAYILAVQ